MPTDCGPGWVWNETLGRCVNNDPGVAGPALELPAVLSDYMRRAFNLITGSVVDSATWAQSRARTIAESIYNNTMANNQQGFTVANLPGVGEITIIPGLNGDGFGPFFAWGVPFKVKIGGTAPGQEPPNDTRSVITEGNEVLIRGLYAENGSTGVPTPLLPTVADILTVSWRPLLQAENVPWPSFEYGGVTHDEVAEVRVKASMKEQLGDLEFEGSPVLKGSVDAAFALYVLEHLQVEIADIEAPGGTRMVPLASVVLPFVSAVSNHAQFTSAP